MSRLQSANQVSPCCLVLVLDTFDARVPHPLPVLQTTHFQFGPSIDLRSKQRTGTARVSGLEGTAGRSPGVNLNMADGAVGQWAKEKRIAGDDDSQLNAGKENEIRSSTDDDTEDESDAHFPAPLSNGAYRKILKELPDGPRIATETCVKFWKVQPRHFSAPALCLQGLWS
jgi:hypothetical protein